MFGTWVVAAAIRFSSNADQTLGRLASQTKLTNAQFAAQNKLINANQLALIRYQERLAAVRAEHMRMLQVGAGVGAAIGFAAIGTAVNDASKLQQILISTRNVLGRSTTDKQMESIYQAAFNLGNRYAMSPVEAADLIRTIARGMTGQFGATEVLRMAPNVAAFAQVLHATRPDENIEEAAKQAIQMAHLFRQYDPKGMTEVLDLGTRMAESMPDSVRKALTQLTYMVPTMKTLNMQDTDAMATMVLMSRFGFGQGKGGTNTAQLIQQMLAPLQLTSHAQQNKLKLLKELHLVGADGRSLFMKDNQFQYFPALEQLSKWAKGKRADDVARMFISTFGVQGGRIADLVADPKFMQALKDVSRFMGPKGTSLGLNQQSATIMGTMAMQWQRAVNNFGAVMTELGYPWLDDLTKFFRSIGDYLHNFQSWLHTHKREEKFLGGAVAGGTAVLTGIAAAGAIGFLSRIFGLGNMIGAVGPRLGILGSFLGSFSGFLRGLGSINMNSLRDVGGLLGRFVTQLRGWLQPMLEVILGVVGIPGKRMGRAGAGGVNWAVHGLGGGLMRLGANMASGSGLLEVLFGRTLLTAGGIGPAIGRFLESIVGVAGVPGKSMGRAGLAGINWAVRGLGGGALALAERMAGGSNFFGVLIGRIVKSLFGGGAAIAAAMPVLRSVLGKVFTRFIPVVGEILFAIDLIRMLMPVWDKYKGQVGYTLGYVFGSIAKMIVDSVRGIFTWVGSVIGAIRANPAAFLANPGAVIGGAGGPSFLDEMGRGFRSGQGGHAFQPAGHEGVHIHGDVILHLPGPHAIGPTLDALKHLKGQPSVKTAPFQPLNFAL